MKLRLQALRSQFKKKRHMRYVFLLIHIYCFNFKIYISFCAQKTQMFTNIGLAAPRFTYFSASRIPKELMKEYSFGVKMSERPVNDWGQPRHSWGWITWEMSRISHTHWIYAALESQPLPRNTCFFFFSFLPVWEKIAHPPLQDQFRVCGSQL